MYDGESMERFWSFMSFMSSQLKEMTPQNRKDHLDAVLLCYLLQVNRHRGKLLTVLFSTLLH
jgi:hypothetical protein